MEFNIEILNYSVDSASQKNGHKSYLVVRSVNWGHSSSGASPDTQEYFRIFYANF